MSERENQQITPRRMATNGAKEGGDHAINVTTSEQDKDNKAKKAMEEDLKHFNIIFGFTQAIGLLCVVLMLIWTSSYSGGFGWRSNPDGMFNWHPLLMTVGFIYLFANSIMIYRALRSLKKTELKLIHAGIHTLVVVCVLIAQVAVFGNHSLTNKPNLYSLHSWVGLTAIIIYVSQWISSIIIFLYPGAPMPLRSAVMPWHVFLGLTAFGMAIIAAVAGLLETAVFRLGAKYGQLPGEAVLMNSLGLLFILFAALVVYLTTEPKYKRHPQPEDRPILGTATTE